MPGTPGLEHRIGGIEKADKTGNITYDPDNHDFMVRTRQAKVDGIARSLPPLEVDDPDGDARVLVLGWGSTYGPIGAACRQVRRGRAARSRRRTCATSTRSRPTSARSCARYERGRDPGDEPGPAGAADPGASTWSTRSSVTQVRGLPFKADELAEMLQGVIEP